MFDPRGYGDASSVRLQGLRTVPQPAGPVAILALDLIDPPRGSRLGSAGKQRYPINSDIG